MFPVFCVSAKKDMGVRRLMEFINNVVPNVSEMPVPVDKNGVEVPYDTAGPTSIFVFKTSVEPHLGEVSFFKVMSGRVQEGMDLVNMNKDSQRTYFATVLRCRQYAPQSYRFGSRRYWRNS
jgi:elongation factor G